MCRSPRLIAAYRGLPRLRVPRHPPHALARLTTLAPVASRARALSRSAVLHRTPTKHQLKRVGTNQCRRGFASHDRSAAPTAEHPASPQSITCQTALATKQVADREQEINCSPLISQCQRENLLRSTSASITKGREEYSPRAVIATPKNPDGAMARVPTGVPRTPEAACPGQELG